MVTNVPCATTRTTGWPEAIALESTIAKHCTEILIHDRGPQFLSKIHTSNSSLENNGSIKDNIDKLKKYRADYNPPECWYFIFSEVFEF